MSINPGCTETGEMEVWTSSIYGLPDIDGDGCDELLLYGGVGGVGIGSGQEVIASDGATLAAAFTDVSVPDELEPVHDYPSPGNWDGDGLADLAWVEQGGTEASDCVYIASYTAPFGGDVLANTLQEICFPNVTLGQLRGDSDLDGDGLLDPILALTGHGLVSDDEALAAANYIVPTSWLDGGRVDVPDVGFQVIGDVDNGATLLTADLDDDGLPELISSRHDAADADYVGAASSAEGGPMQVFRGGAP